EREGDPVGRILADRLRDAEFDEIEDILAFGRWPGTESTPQFGACGVSSGARYHVARNERPLSFRLPPWALESHPSRHNEIVVGDRICRHRHLITDPDDEVIALRSAGNWKATEYDTWSEQHLTQMLMHSVREVLVVDLEFRPEVFEDVILK